VAVPKCAITWQGRPVPLIFVRAQISLTRHNTSGGTGCMAMLSNQPPHAWGSALAGYQASLTRRARPSETSLRGLKPHGYRQFIATRWLAPVMLGHPFIETDIRRGLDSARIDGNEESRRAPQPANPSKDAFTTAPGRNKDGRGEANAFIDRRESLAYHPEMGR
jgi:hypothetical protein